MRSCPLLKGKKKHKVLPKIILLIPAVVILVFLTRLVAASQLLNISSVQIDGPLPLEAKNNLINTLKSKNIFTISNNDVQRELSKQGNVKLDNIDKKFPNSLIVKVSTDQAVLSWQSSKGRFLVDGLGNVYAEAGSEQIPQISSPDSPETIGDKIDPKLINLVQLLTTKFVVLTVSLQDQVIRANLGNGIALILNYDGDIVSEVQALQLISSKAKIDGRLPRIVDLRFSKPVVTF